MRHRTEAHLPGRCRRCWMKDWACLCPEMPRIEVRTGFLVVRHGREAEKSTNSARIAALAVPSLRIIDHTPYLPEAPGGDALLAGLERELSAMPAPALLFPGAAAPSQAPPSHLVVLDGTWRQARKMLRSMPALGALPRVSLPPRARSGPVLRENPAPENLSTLEAIAAAIEALEGEALAAPLFRLHHDLVRAVFMGRGYLPRAAVAP